MILSYSLVSALILACGYLAYRLVMAGECQHTLNRRAIMTIYAGSLLLPLIMLPLITHNQEHFAELPHMGAGVMAVEPGEIENVDPVRHMTSLDTADVAGWIRVVSRIYLGGVIAVGIYCLYGVAMLLRIVRKGERTDYEGYTLILTDNMDIAPFSWGKTVVMDRADYTESGDMILLHECGHIRFGHWLDLLVAQFALIVQWYNPAAWALRDELMIVHEYQADDAVMSAGIDIGKYQSLLIRKAVGSRFQSLANSLNHSKLKKRVTMMYKKQTPMRRRLAVLIVAPALAAGCGLAALPAVADVIGECATVHFSPASLSSEELSPAPFAAPEEIYQKVDVAAEFPGGQRALMEYLMKNVHYPDAEFKAGVQGRVIVKFVVEADGSIGKAEIIKKVNPALDEEALRLVEGMPKWTPGKVNGKPVASYFHIPVSFKIKDDEVKESSDNPSGDKTSAK